MTDLPPTPLNATYYANLAALELACDSGGSRSSAERAKRLADGGERLALTRKAAIRRYNRRDRWRRFAHFARKCLRCLDA